MKRQLQSAPITGYYEYLSQVRHRVDVALHEGAGGREPMTNVTTTVPTASTAPVTDDGDRASATDSTSANNSLQQSSNLNDKEVTKWSSLDVQQWAEEQCQKFELKKIVTQKFQMNGQALVLLTKHDFLRRLPDGGEILFYALRRLIQPNTSQSVRADQNVRKNRSSRSNPRIVELTSDTDESSGNASASTSPKPIVEEPDDPPLLRKSESDTTHGNHQHPNYSRSFLYSNSYIHQPVFAMPANTFYQSQQAFPNHFAYVQQNHHHHHPQMHQQQFFHQQAHPHQHLLNQYYQILAAQGISIEMIDHETAINLIANGVSRPSNDTSSNGITFNPEEQLYLATISGQRYIFTEEQLRQYVIEIQQNQQQHFQTQQQHFQQQRQFQQAPQDNSHYTL